MSLHHIKISSGVLPRTVSIQISNNGIDFVSSSRTFTYLYQVSVTSISPKHGALEGGTRVIVRGSHFVNNEVLACKFGDIVVAASFVTSSELICLSPSHNVGRVAVEVSTNRVDYSGNGVLYTFKMQSTVSFIEPRLGPISGGTLVTVHGNNFIQGTNFYCRFGETSRGVVKGTWVATSLIQCISPPSSHPSTKAVYVSTNLVDFTRKSVKAFFTHTRELELKSLAPTSGPAFGGTNVSVFGENFYPLPSGAKLRCRFGQKVVAAYIVTPYQLACATPTFSLPNHVNQAKVNVSVSLNGAQYTVMHGQYSIYRDVEVSEILPTFGPSDGGTTVEIDGTNFFCFINRTNVGLGTYLFHSSINRQH